MERHYLQSTLDRAVWHLLATHLDRRLQEGTGTLLPSSRTPALPSSPSRLPSLLLSLPSQTTPPRRRPSFVSSRSVDSSIPPRTSTYATRPTQDMNFSTALKDFHDRFGVGVTKTIVVADGLGHAYVKIHCKVSTSSPHDPHPSVTNLVVPPPQKLPKHEWVVGIPHFQDHWIPLAGSRWEFRTVSHRVTIVWITRELYIRRRGAALMLSSSSRVGCIRAFDPIREVVREWRGWNGQLACISSARRRERKSRASRGPLHPLHPRKVFRLNTRFQQPLQPAPLAQSLPILVPPPHVLAPSSCLREPAVEGGKKKNEM